MLILRMFAADVADLPPDLEGALAELSEDYRRVLDRGIEAQAEALGVARELLRGQVSGESSADTVVRFAELLATPAGVIGVYATEPRFGRGGARLQLYGVGSHEIAQLLHGLARSLSERYDIDLRPNRYESARFEQLLQTGSRATSAPSAEQLNAARLLADPAVRSVARSIAASGSGLLTSDVSKQLDAASQARAEKITASLESLGLASAELVVTCTRSESQILRVPSRGALEMMAEAGARCACGRPLLDERLEEADMLTERGRGLLTASRWMVLLLVSTLHALGIDYDVMVVEQQPASEEIDCFVDISGELCLFELKDGEFSLDNAYALGAKLGRHKPEHTMVITTSSVDSDAREHLRRPQPPHENNPAAERTSAIACVEGIDGIVVDLGSLIESIYVSHSVDLLRQCLPFVTLDAASLVGALRAPEDAVDPAAPSRSRVADRR
jgi:hypothetical protein